MFHVPPVHSLYYVVFQTIHALIYKELKRNAMLPVTGDSHDTGWNAAWHGVDPLVARCSLNCVQQCTIELCRLDSL